MVPEVGDAAIVGGQFETKVGNLQDKLINTVLPLMSIFGLVLAGIYAAIGKEDAKNKIVVILAGSTIGFLAPHIIGWLKGILG